MREARKALPPAERDRRSAAVTELLLGLPELDGASTALVFHSFGAEIPTTDLTARLVHEGKRVLLPFVEGHSLAAAEFIPGSEGALVETAYGPMEPASRVPVDPADVDVIVLPGLAFDRAGYRLGYGRGYYDRFLAGPGARAVRIGIGFGFQLVDSVPHGPGDERLDLIVTDRGIIRCPPRR